jgi:hypothetical protein
MRDTTIYLLAAALSLALLTLGSQDDFTDAGVGCLDDCLDRIEDEAQTATSQQRENR